MKIKNYVSRILFFSGLLITLLFGSVSVFADSDSVPVVLSDSPITLQEIDSTVQLLAVSPSNTSGFKSVVLGLLGDYNPVVTDHTYQSSSGYITHSIDIQPDYSWICSAAIFTVVIFCIFRLFGGLISK